MEMYKSYENIIIIGTEKSTKNLKETKLFDLSF